MTARLLAFVAAIAMVAGSVALRSRMDDYEVRATTSLRLVCATELGPACEAMSEDDKASGRLEVTTEPAGITAARLMSPDGGGSAAAAIDGWLVTAPWPAIVRDGRRAASLAPLISAGPVLARSPVVLAVWPERAAALQRRCSSPSVGWRCLGDNAGRRWAEIGGPAAWGPVKFGHSAVSTATGLTVVGAATAAFFGRTDLTRDDLADEGYQDWLTRLERSIPSDLLSPLDDMLIRGPGAVDVVGTTEAEAAPLLARSARVDKPGLLYPSPVATADVVLSTTGGGRAERLAEVVAGGVGGRALTTGGWRVEGQRRPAGARGALPPTSGLPPPGVLEAIRRAVQEIA